MVHPALLRTSVPLASRADRPPVHGAFWAPAGFVRKLHRRLTWWMASQYRPERHYMRGGRTAGAKSLAAG